MSDDVKKQGPRRLFCLSGGGLPGLDIYAGMWRALEAHGITPAEIHGTSAGACFGALIAHGKRVPARLIEILCGLDQAAIRAERFMWRFRALWINHFMGNEGIREALEQYLPADFSELEIPLHVYAVNNSNGLLMDFHRGDLREAVLASMAIPGVFPEVHIGHAAFSDGGTKENLPIPPYWNEFDEVWLLVSSRPVNYAKRRKGMLSQLLLAIDLMAEDQMEETLRRIVKDGGPKIHVLRPQLGIDRGGLRFAHDLIDEAYRWTTGSLAFDRALARTRPNQRGN